MEHASFSSHFETIDGVSVYYELYGYTPAKPAIVLVHGFLSSSFSFRRLIPLLTKDFSVIAVDLPPFGQSEKSLTFVYSYKNLAKLITQLIRKLHLNKVILVGHSMGGQISLNTAKLEPDLVDKIILLCSSGYLSRSHYGLILSSYLPYFYLWIKTWLARKGIDGNLKNVVYDLNMIDEEMIQGYMKPFSDDKIFMALTRMIRHREGDLSSEDLRSIEVPSLLIWGEEDRVVPLNIGKRLKQDIQNSTLISFQKTGHLVPEEKPEAIHQHMLQFLY
ncbi:alpha/beta fold hydrolase [Bacillus songklensis]|uniref:Alpha/beta fold hydrolase n=1 Tax=Bacillus songklensis TaxID=1069116 RepID=A0ABV8BBB5_9BACI